MESIFENDNYFGLEILDFSTLIKLIKVSPKSPWPAEEKDSA